MIACDDDGNHAALVEHNVSLTGLAVDWIHGLVFWTDWGLKTVNVMNLNTKQRKVLFNEDIDSPGAIAVDPSKGLIFWTDWKKETIERASMDGNDRMTIVNSSSSTGIALDIFHERVYWADRNTNTIASIDYNENDRRTILRSSTYIKYPFSLAIFEDKLYWADVYQKGVFVMNKFNGTEVRQLINDVFEPRIVRVYHNAVQPELPNKCNHHSCGDGAICLPKDNSFKNRTGLPYSCVCADGYKTGEEPNTCVLSIVSNVFTTTVPVPVVPIPAVPVPAAPAPVT
uniref:EGF-like domain-containing protein n=1 Tax=Acrobeloides nanus TaxID=290746 RepID=A0A914E267_9BILA